MTAGGLNATTRQGDPHNLIEICSQCTTGAFYRCGSQERRLELSQDDSRMNRRRKVQTALRIKDQRHDQREMEGNP